MIILNFTKCATPIYGAVQNWRWLSTDVVDKYYRKRLHIISKYRVKFMLTNSTKGAII